MTNEMFSIMNELDTAADNMAVSLDTISYVLEGLDKAATEVKKGDGDSALRLVSKYGNYSRMLFLLLDQTQRMNKQACELISRAFEIDRKEVLA